MKNLFLTILVITPFFCLSQKPTDQKATRETVKLYQNLMKLQSKSLMFGHQDALAYGEGWVYEEGRSDVKDVCGDYPAVYGWEIGHLELGDAYSLDSVHFDKIQNWIKIVYERGGVNTISWHLRNPLTGGTSWDVSSKEVVNSILPGGSKHEVFKGYLDKLATFLLALKTEDGIYIPVLFRPFHEHTGSWFWWGKDLCSVEDYKSFGNLR
jgi:mannan endo-1,4-beta-mannosidase